MFRKLPISFYFILGAGVVLGLILSLKTLIPYLYWDELSEYSWHRSALPHWINYLFWPVLVPLIYWTLLKFKLAKGASLQDRLITFLMSLAIPLAHEIVTTILYFTLLHWMDVFHFNEETWPQLMAAFPGVYLGRVVEFWIIYGLFAAFDYYKRYRDKQAELGKIEAQLNRTKLEVLRMQLQPHFLFNALNTISSLMDVDVKKAQNVTARLGDLLRGILEQDNRIFVSLEEELNYVRTYLEIEMVRFEDRLQVAYDIDDEVLGVQVPLLIVQPLVENAIKHGVAKVSRKGEVRIAAKIDGDHVRITVGDNGQGQQREVNALFKSGIGLQNTKERIRELYSGQASMYISTGPNAGFKVELVLPKAYKL